LLRACHLEVVDLWVTQSNCPCSSAHAVSERAMRAFRPRREQVEGALHSPRNAPGIAALEVAVARQRPQRKIFRIAVIAQIEPAGKPNPVLAGPFPEAAAPWLFGEIFDAAPPRRMIEPAGRHQTEPRPGRLRGG